MTFIRILGIDPGLSNLGVACITMDGDGFLQLNLVKLISTKKRTKKLGIREKADDMRRLTVLEKELQPILDEWKPDVVALEECPSLRSSSSTRKVAIAWGAVHALSTRLPGVVSLEYDPQALKVAMVGDKKASKAKIIAEVTRQFPSFADCGVAPSNQEHIADAVMAAYTASQDPLVVSMSLALKRMNKGS